MLLKKLFIKHVNLIIKLILNFHRTFRIDICSKKVVKKEFL